jgi:hypothetical protein
VRLTQTHGVFAPLTIFVVALRAGALPCVPRMKRSVSTPNRSVNADAPVRGGNLANACGGTPVNLFR